MKIIGPEHEMKLSKWGYLQFIIGLILLLIWIPIMMAIIDWILNNFHGITGPPWS